MKNSIQSIWAEEFKQTKPELSNDLNVDTLIIGGGICGILCAYYLKQKGVSSVIVDKNIVGSGITKNSTAVISVIQETLYHKFLSTIGLENTKLFLSANCEAIKEYEKLSTKYDFDYEHISTYLYSNLTNNILEKEQSFLASIGYQTNLMENLSNPFIIKSRLEFENQAQMNPVKLINQLKQELDYYENTKILNIINNIAYTDKYKITANRIIVACHFPFIDRKGFYFAKMYQKQSFVVSVKSNKILDGSYVDISHGGYYLRQYKNNILIGANDRRTATKGPTYENIVKFSKDTFLDSEFISSWSNEDCITLDGIPYVGYYSKKSKNLFVATGFNLWGMTSSMICATVISEMIINGISKYEKLLSPSRKIKKFNLLINSLHTTKYLLSPKLKRCSHLGCALKYNKNDQTFECPCHGTRYDKNGEVIDGPGIKNI